jgi:hypothetical protein
MDAASRRALVTGFLLLAVSIPMGITLETLHAFKVQAYLGSSMRREMWTLAHAHGNLLAVLCLAFAAVAERAIADARVRARVSVSLVLGAVAMPLGFFAGGIGSAEGDPSVGIVLVPLGALCLLDSLLRAAWAARRGV